MYILNSIKYYYILHTINLYSEHLQPTFGPRRLKIFWIKYSQRNCLKFSLRGGSERSECSESSLVLYMKIHGIHKKKPLCFQNTWYSKPGIIPGSYAFLIDKKGSFPTPNVDSCVVRF